MARMLSPGAVGNQASIPPRRSNISCLAAERCSKFGKIGTDTIYHSVEHPSVLTLPVMEGGAREREGLNEH